MSPPQLTIRQAQPGDAGFVAALHGQIVRDTLVTFTTVEKPLATWQAEISSGQPFLIAAAGEQPLGFATYGPFRGGPGYAHVAEHSIYLSDQAKGQGIGRQLLFALEERARAAHIHVLVAAISGANPAACSFHAACGYEEVARMPGLGNKWGRYLDLILMQKILCDPDLCAADMA